MKTRKLQKPRVPAPPDRIEFRADVENPGLAERFNGLLHDYTGDKAAVLRALVIAWCERTEEDNAIPKVPLRVESKKAK